MNTITLHMENRADNTAVSNYFIDTLMPQANGEFVKIYLYLLRCVSAGHISLSVSEMADLFNQTEADILRGLRYWDKMNALRLNFSPDGMLTASPLRIYPLRPLPGRLTPAMQTILSCQMPS